MLVAIALLSFTTSALSGVLGMGGGLILMAGLLYCLPVGQAMILHGLIQLWANGQRAIHQRSSLDFIRFGQYAVAAVAAVIVLRIFVVQLDKVAITGLLGVLAIMGASHPRGLWMPSYRNPQGAYLSGALVSGLQVILGVAGPLLDLFFRREVQRQWVVGNKGLTQSLSHLLKIGFYGSLTGQAQLMDHQLILAGLLGVSAASLGTLVGTRLLHGLSDVKFVAATRSLLCILGIFYAADALLRSASFF